MANLWTIGFERMVSAYLRSAAIWDVTQNTSITSSSIPRSGGSTNAAAGGGASSTGIRSLGASPAHIYSGICMLFRVASLPATPTVLDFGFDDGATTQVGWVITASGEIVVYRGNRTIASATELGRTAAGVITAKGTSATGSDYVMIEMEVVFDAGSSGSVVIRVADVVVLTLTGIQTAASANSSANRVFLTTRASSSVHYEDAYVNDNSGSSPENTFFGEAFVVESVIPIGNGNSSQWVGSDGNSTDNYLLVDDTGNDDTDYVKSGTLNDLDTYAMGNLSNATGTVIRASHMFVARKDDVATRTLASTLRTNSTDYVSGTNKTMAGTYGLFIDERTINPDTSLRFTISDINGIEYGTKVTT